jgi:hypothetical protein
MTPASPETAHVEGQPSFLLAAPGVRLAITRFGAMLGPVTFFANDRAPIRPYAVAPWAEERAGASPFLHALRGDFMCSAFGDNVEPCEGRIIPPHGDTVNGDWSLIHRREHPRGAALRLAMDMPHQGGRCVGTTVVLAHHSFVYQRHDFLDRSGPINPGHHAMLSCPPRRASALLSFSPYTLAGTSPLRAALPPSHIKSLLVPGTYGAPLNAMPCLDGTTMDVTSFPSRDGIDDVLIACADPTIELAWSAATFPEERYAWLSLRLRAQLPSTLIWLSNGGMLQPPWNGRHKAILGIEDIMGYFSVGLAESARANPLNARGIQTATQMRPHVPLRIPYIQGVVRIPAGFNRVAAIEPAGSGQLSIRDVRGVEVRAACEWEFLNEARIEGLCEDDSCTRA